MTAELTTRIKLARKPDPATEELGRERAAAMVAG